MILPNDLVDLVVLVDCMIIVVDVESITVVCGEVIVFILHLERSHEYIHVHKHPAKIVTYMYMYFYKQT